MNSEYLDLVKKAQEKKIVLVKKQKKYIKDLYSDVASELDKKVKKSSENSLTERWLKDYRKQFKKQIKVLNNELKQNIEESMLKGANYANNVQIDFFNSLSDSYKLSFKDMFSNMFSKIPQNAVNELISGGFYKDGIGLSKRLWNHEGKVNAQFDYIIQKGLLEKKSSYELVKDLEVYINPNKKQDWDFNKIYPNVGNKKIEYNSFRLAVTSISHAYQLSMQRSCKINPFVEGIKWHTSNSHRGPCSLCLSREGKIYSVDDLPMDHPLGICYFVPVIEKSMDEIGQYLHDCMNKQSDFHDDLIDGKKNITSFIKNLFNKSNTEKEFTFLNDLTKIDLDNINGMVSNAPLKFQQLFLRYAEYIKFGDIKYKKTACYNPKENAIYINFRNDRLDIRGKGAYTTFFHELGHMIDTNMGRVSTKLELSTKFKSDIISDINKFILDTKINFNIKSENELNELISNELKSTAKYHSISDIFGGVTGNKISGNFIHKDTYWENKYSLQRETFAHFFEATIRNDEIKLKMFNNILPNAYNTFIYLLRGE